MNGRRVIVGLCVLCALLVSAFAAQSASAVTNGTTAFTCKDEGVSNPNQFTKAHCKAADAGTGKYKHVAFAQDTTTEVELTSKNTNAETNNCTTVQLKAVILGVSVALLSCDIHGTGWMENRLEGPEHYSVGHGTLTFTGVTANLPGCKVWTDTSPTEMGEQGVVHTEPLRATTKGQGDSVKIEPTTGTIIARFYLTSCNTAAFNGTYELSGHLNCVPDGATITCTHNAVTMQNTLKLRAVTPNVVSKAGFEGSLTVKSRANSGESYTPLSVTTVAT